MPKKKSTGKKKSDIAEEAGEELYRKLFETSSDAIMILGRDRFFDCNPATLDMFLISKDEFTKAHPSEISPPKQPNGKSSRKEADRRIDQAFKKGHNKFGWVHRRSNGEDFPATVWLTAFNLEGREVLQATVRDITEQREVENKLQEYKDNLEKLVEDRTAQLMDAEKDVRRLIQAVDTSVNAMALFDLDLNILYANPAFGDIVKENLDKVMKSRATKYVAKESEELLLENIQAALETGEVEKFEIQARTADGKYRLVEVVGSVVYDDSGDPEGLMAIMRDITERREMEESLAETREKYELLVEKANDGILIIQDGKVVYMNPSLVELSGYRLEEQIGRHYLENVAPEERENVDRHFKARMKNKDVPAIYETILLRKDGTKVPMEVNASVVDYNGRPADFVILRDLTERKKAEEEVRNLKERFEYVLGATKTGFDTIDEEYNVHYVDPMWAKELGDYSGKKCYDYFMGGKKPCEGCAIPQVIRTGEMVVSEEYLKREDRHIQVHTIPMGEKDGKRLVAEFNIDITDRREAEMALRQSEEKLRIVMENLPDAVFAHDLDGNMVMINEVSCKNTGYTREELLGMTVADIDRESVTRKDRKKLWLKLEEGESAVLESVHIRKDGTEYPAEIRLNSIALDGEPIILAIAQDITNRKMAVEALKQSEEKYRLLMETANDAIFLADAKAGTLIDVNKTGEELIGRSRGELIGMRQTRLHPKGEAKKYAQIFKDHVKGGSAISEDIYVRHKDGHNIPVMISASTFELDGRTVNQGIFHDLTERKKAEEALRESEEKFRTLANTSSAAIFIHRGGEFLFFNKGTQEISGYSKAELEGMNFLHVVHADFKSTVKERVMGRLKGKKMPQSYEIKILRKDGAEAWLNLTGEPITFEGKEAVIGTAMDITKRKNIEKEVKELKDFSKSTIDNSPVGILTTDMDGNILTANPALVEMLGSPGEGKTTEFNILDMEELVEQGLSELFRQCLVNGEKVKVDNVNYTSVWGKELIVSLDIVPLRDTEDKQIGLVALVEDVTERYKAREALVSSERIYRSLYESTITLADTTDLNEVISVIAEQATSMLGGECSTIYLWNAESKRLEPFYTNAKDRDKFMGHRLKLGEGLTGKVAKQKRGRYINFDRDAEDVRGYIPGTKKDRDHLQSIIAEPMLEGENLLGVINVIAEEYKFDEVDRSKMEILAHQASIAYMRTKNLEALTQSEARFRRMTDNIHDGLTIIEDGKVVFVNDRACEIFGYSREELEHMELADLMEPEDREQVVRLQENFRRMGKSLGEIEFWIVRKSGEKRYVRARTSTSQEGEHTSEFIITTDITERKLAEDEAKRSKMKFILEDGRAYLVTEFKPEMSAEAFKDLIGIDYAGIVISRTPKRDLKKNIQGQFEHIWLGEADLEEEDMFENILSRARELKGKAVVLVDRLDYLIIKHGFRETLAFIYSLRDMVYLREQIAIFSIDPSTISDDELNLIQKEMKGIEQRQVPRPSEELFEIVERIYEKNSAGIKPSYSEIGSNIGVSKPTFRKRVRRLISSGYVMEFTKGNKKVLELTQKGRSLFFR